MVSHNISLPTFEELTVPELKLSTCPLLAASIHLGKFCDNESKEFMLCHYETHDPRACLGEGKALTSCAQNFFRKIKKHCDNEFRNYYICLNKYGGPAYSLQKCRSLQYPFDECIKTHLNQERPKPGYYNVVRLHKTDRPRYEPGSAPMPERIPDLADFDLAEEPERLKHRRKMNELLI
ncbi:NADH dehydrogenase [ubiquinone] 1 alpha subcomplex subunit 8 [Schistosoma japonicum]|uniref:NADH dehydrogenase [ubiquinone] 1 alpha subcomplex subunit 8 n=1 Tax=Schistosoma japonicum TaxID=6182 RepID=Q5DFB6_SCHJA|nr:unknown [Schistosoma japonicum]AAX30161.1 SJCHGC01237 protein [Schistosoma japonicum]KAH8871507.1 NADH dehydrogenase (ubiquinone) 1 alpha subcomplex subunit 8 [Schistosoma japonicum]KAH8871508.1 NADH dehydrogenase (ubiquinone) 1 alpha subcomplex subunit 8 [Schistosoma japonicum]KAH8871509.1 NADH dehydrogenase (ubiquinone) 1 alpha subcomplex subunit 8 [Schistosoma japonicum]